jgi:hypothetical protein
MALTSSQKMQLTTLGGALAIIIPLAAFLVSYGARNERVDTAITETTAAVKVQSGRVAAQELLLQGQSLRVQFLEKDSAENKAANQMLTASFSQIKTDHAVLKSEFTKIVDDLKTVRDDLKQELRQIQKNVPR